jgi:hypothetical protein
MNISAANAYATLMSRMAASNAGSGATSTTPPGASTDAASATADQTSAGGVQSVDFTKLTRKGLADWVNGQITSGLMSVQDSSPFLSLGLNASATDLQDGSTGLDDSQSVNFLQMAQSALTSAQQSGDSASAQQMQSILAVMQQAQGQVTGLDITA